MNIDEINPSQIESLRTPFLENQAQATVQTAKPEEVKVETEKLAQLAEQVQKMPDNRPEVVSHGKELLADSKYPSPDVEEQVAKVLLGVQQESY